MLSGKYKDESQNTNRVPDFLQVKKPMRNIDKCKK